MRSKQITRSIDVFRRAQRVTPGGVSPVRAIVNRIRGILLLPTAPG